MLRDLHIRNLAVLAEASIAFDAGFNVLSGETGAGKSIVVDSLALLSGVRANAELIRTGADSLTITGVFEPAGEAWRHTLDAAGLESTGVELVIRREIARNGRNRVFVDDQPATVGLLAKLAPHVLRIHGQREELGLVDPELQRSWLDRTGGESAARLLADVARAWDEQRRLRERLEHLTGDDQARRERIDFLRFQLDEIDDVRPVTGEEIELRAERDVLRHSEAIVSALTQAESSLFEGETAAYESLEQARVALARITAWEPAAEEWVGELADIGIRVNELSAALRHRLDVVEADPGRLDEVESRLAALERLMRKHGSSVAEVLARRAQIEHELAELEGDETSHAELQTQVDQALDHYREVATALSAARREWAVDYGARLQGELADLALANARFDVAIEKRRRAGSALEIDGEPVEMTRHGYDRVVYRFAPNPGEEPRPLAKIASGGELSRLYLAVQLASRGDDEVHQASVATLVFDEVDTGVGGAEAAVLGSKLRRLARGGQVLAVTHMPQVASSGDQHFKVSKDIVDGRTRTMIDALDPDARVREVARMLAGSEITELSLSHASEMIEGAAGL
ncbi:MAG: DNA repair protein RecN [Acidobacteriota bacterium]